MCMIDDYIEVACSFLCNRYFIDNLVHGSNMFLDKTEELKEKEIPTNTNNVKSVGLLQLFIYMYCNQCFFPAHSVLHCNFCYLLADCCCHHYQ